MYSTCFFLESKVFRMARQKVPKNSSRVIIPNHWIPSTDSSKYLYIFLYFLMSVPKRCR
jgi:hypothetical protein